jgi:hypothetical protein
MNLHLIEEEPSRQLSGGEQMKLVDRFGRGRSGGTTFLDFLIQRALQANRRVMIGDGDVANPTLTSFYPGVAVQPKSEEMADVMDWITTLGGQMVETNRSLVLYIGGGDRIIGEHARDINLPEFCASVGAECLTIYVMGPRREDLEHVLSIFRSGHFNSARAITVLNETLVRAGKNPAIAFDWLYEEAGFMEIADAAKIVAMRRLPCMEQMRAEGLSFYDVVNGVAGKTSGKPLDMARRFMVQSWINKLEQQITERGISDWLP